MADDPSRIDAPDGWVEALLQGKADIAAGRTVPLQPVIDELRADAERLEYELRVAQKDSQAAVQR